ncbi:MAG: GSCFA domain-containing protein [Sporocytophaga sp.]|uniref:GSCFA domain-containing protein n=1 Tax=Sporocytophaga sp. TaxID=2231183 RepID=UPI001B29895F|nr:GSCFA domain-containing protein [Sporocytophaga sp.]MBO9701363.1 GSCFA domain-containing protein [Sporocytophaga sp.]
MNLRTELTIENQGFTLSHQSTILTAGSCFAEVIGNKLKDAKFQSLVNPFGTIFNPLSLFSLLQNSIDNQYLSQDYFIQQDDIWYNYDFHSDLSALTKNELWDKIRVQINETNGFLKKVDLLIITLGTSYIYKLLPDNKAVANCHKKPSSYFSKNLLTSEEIVSAFSEVYPQLKKFNPDLKILLTVSPVRHIKDTITLNFVSKSILRVAVHQLTEKFKDVFYFPAYEIMMDDLRDYRFYKDDLIHPTSMAENYIWEKFSECYFSEETNNILVEWNQVQKALNHKAFNPYSAAHQKFLRDTINKLNKFKNLFSVDSEIKALEKQLL